MAIDLGSIESWYPLRSPSSCRRRRRAPAIAASLLATRLRGRQARSGSARRAIDGDRLGEYRVMVPTSIAVFVPATASRTSDRGVSDGYADAWTSGSVGIGSSGYRWRSTWGV